MDLDVFTKEFAKYGGKIAPGAAVSYTSPTDTRGPERARTRSRPRRSSPS